MNNDIVFRDFAVNGGWYCNVCEQHLHPDMVPNHKHQEALPNPTTPRVNKPHAANSNPHDPANPSKLYRDENGVYLYATKDQYGNLIPPHEHVYRCQDCGEIGSSPDAYERGRRDELEEGRRMTSGGDYKAGPEYFTSRLNELEKGKPDGE